MWKCPKCKNAASHKLRIEAHVTVVIDSDGESAEPVDGNFEWGSDAVAHCSCGFIGTAGDCVINESEGETCHGQEQATTGRAG